MRRFDLGYRCLEISPAPFDLNAVRHYGKLTLSMSVGSQLVRACELLVFDSTIVREDALEILAPDCDLSVQSSHGREHAPVALSRKLSLLR